MAKVSLARHSLELRGLTEGCNKRRGSGWLEMISTSCENMRCSEMTLEAVRAVYIYQIIVADFRVV